MKPHHIIRSASPYAAQSPSNRVREVEEEAAEGARWLALYLTGWALVGGVLGYVLQPVADWLLA